MADKDFVFIDRLTSACDVLGEMSDLFMKMPEAERESVLASLHIQATRLYLMDFARLLADGMDPYDAMVHAAIGDVPID